MELYQTVLSLMNNAVSMMIHQLNSKGVVYLPTIAMRTIPSWNCTACYRKATTQIRFIDCNQQDLLVLALCDECDEQLENAVHIVKDRLKKAIYPIMMQLQLRYSAYEPDCVICNQIDSTWASTEKLYLQLCTPCMIMSKWVKYRYVYMVLRSMCTDVRYICVSLIMLDDIITEESFIDTTRSNDDLYLILKSVARIWRSDNDCETGW